MHADIAASQQLRNEGHVLLSLSEAYQAKMADLECCIGGGLLPTRDKLMLQVWILLEILSAFSSGNSMLSLICTEYLLDLEILIGISATDILHLWFGWYLEFICAIFTL